MFAPQALKKVRSPPLLTTAKLSPVFTPGSTDTPDMSTPVCLKASAAKCPSYRLQYNL